MCNVIEPLEAHLRVEQMKLIVIIRLGWVWITFGLGCVFIRTPSLTFGRNVAHEAVRRNIDTMCMFRTKVARTKIVRTKINQRNVGRKYKVEKTLIISVIATNNTRSIF